MSDECDKKLTGLGVTDLSGVGPAVWLEEHQLELEEPEGSITPKKEVRRFEDSRSAVKDDLRSQRDRTVARLGEDEAAIFDAHIRYLNDPELSESVVEKIRHEELPAEQAVKRAFADVIDKFEATGGAISERADDLRDIRTRLLHSLLGKEGSSIDSADSAVLLAERLTPSVAADLEPDQIAGVATITGGETSHAAILARSLAIPAVLGIGSRLREIDSGRQVLVDGRNDEIVIEPSQNRVNSLSETSERDILQDPVTTQDGREITVAANIGSAEEAKLARQNGADEIGLFRTEFYFSGRETPPTEAEQYDAVVEVLRTMEERKVVVRTLDAGGDKPIPYLDIDDGVNPFLGRRGIRTVPGVYPELFETQLRALLRAGGSEYGESLGILFPFVTTVAELEDILDRVESVANQLADENIDYAIPELGVMIETPAAAAIAGELGGKVDFLSIGTNDLTQYVTAASRDNDSVSDLYDPFHPAVIKAIAQTVESNKPFDNWIGVCGEIAGDESFSQILIGLGIDELSVPSQDITNIKKSISDNSYNDSKPNMKEILSATNSDEVRSIIERTD